MADYMFDTSGLVKYYHPEVGSKKVQQFMATLKYRLALAEEALGNRKEALKSAEEAVHWFERLGIKPDVGDAKKLVKRLHGRK